MDIYLLNNTTLFDRRLVCTVCFLSLMSIYKKQALSVTLWVHETDVCVFVWKKKRHTFHIPSLKGSGVLTRARAVRELSRPSRKLRCCDHTNSREFNDSPRIQRDVAILTHHRNFLANLTNYCHLPQLSPSPGYTKGGNSALRTPCRH